jgi:hypothetical protein
MGKCLHGLVTKGSGGGDGEFCSWVVAAVVVAKEDEAAV